jgi:outer membrane protein OmpA-like peptidoglycan-associated protein
MIKKGAVVAALVVLSGCTAQHIADVKSMKPMGSTFETGLHQEYLTLAQGEYDESDWSDADFFASKGGTAAGGKSEGPQAIAARGLPADMVDELTAVRARLVTALDAGGRDKMPDVAARAQAMFDCWMQEQEENFQPEDIAACRDGFYTALLKLEPKPMVPKVMAPAPPPPPAAPKKVGPFVVLFDFDKSNVNKLSQLVVDLIVAEAGTAKPKMIALSGHTDKAGEDGYNMVLSKKRVDAVTAALIKGGVAPSMIGTAIFGEEKPAQMTADGKRSAKNRRVTVEFKF